MRPVQQPTFEELYAQYGDRLYRYCFRLCRGNEADAEDLAQETLILAFRHLEGFQGKSNVQTWLYRIALNTWLKRREKRGAGEESMDQLDRCALGEDPTGGQLTRLWLESGLSALPEALYQAIVLVKAEGLTHREAAAVLGVPQGTVQFRVHEAVKRLRKILAEDPRSPYLGAFMPASLLDTELSRWGNVPVAAPPGLQARVQEALQNGPVGGDLSSLPAALRPPGARTLRLDRRAVLAGGGLLGLLVGSLTVVKSTRLASPAKEVERMLGAMRGVRTARATGIVYSGVPATERAVNIERFNAEFVFREPNRFARRLTPLEMSAAAPYDEILIDGPRTVWNSGPKGGVWRVRTGSDALAFENMAPFDFFSPTTALAQAIQRGAKVTTTTSNLNGERVFVSTVLQHTPWQMRQWVIKYSAKTNLIRQCEVSASIENRGVWQQIDYVLLNQWEYEPQLEETKFRPSSRPPSE